MTAVNLKDKTANHPSFWCVCVKANELYAVKSNELLAVKGNELLG